MVCSKWKDMADATVLLKKNAKNVTENGQWVWF